MMVIVMVVVVMLGSTVATARTAVAAVSFPVCHLFTTNTTALDNIGNNVGDSEDDDDDDDDSEQKSDDQE